MKSLDFNALVQPTLTLTMKDEARTVIQVTTPTERLVERLTAGMADLKTVLAAQDSDSTSAAFALAADLISCNTDGIPVTCEDLRGKYRFELYDLLAFYKVYMEFISEIQTAKN